MTLSLLRMRTISFLWGFGEATFFFFVPDIWLTYLVLVNCREGYRNIPFVIAGALAGGAVMYLYGAYASDSARLFLDTVPAIGPALIDGARESMREGHPLVVMQAGSLSGVPYKIYAVVGGEIGLSPVLFAVYSVIARGVRFLLVTSLAAAVGYFLLKRMSVRTVLIVNTICWAVFYSFYFYKFSA